MSNVTSLYDDLNKNGIFDKLKNLNATYRIDETSTRVKQGLHEIQLSHNYAVCCVTFALNCMSNLVTKWAGPTPIDLDYTTREYTKQIEQILDQFDQEITAILRVEPESNVLTKDLQESLGKENL